jgi:hypothetical protein
VPLQGIPAREGSFAAQGAEEDKPQMGFDDMVQKPGASALPPAGTSDDEPPAGGLAIALCGAVPMDVLEMTGQPPEILVEEDGSAACVDVACHRWGVKEKRRKSHMLEEDVTKEGVAPKVSSNGGGTAVDTAHDGGRGLGD